MGVSYNRLWKMLIDKNMKRKRGEKFLPGWEKTSMYQWRRLRRSARSWTAPLMRCWNLQMMSNKSRHVKLLKLEECFRSRKKKLKKDNTPDTA